MKNTLIYIVLLILVVSCKKENKIRNDFYGLWQVDQWTESDYGLDYFNYGRWENFTCTNSKSKQCQEGGYGQTADKFEFKKNDKLNRIKVMSTELLDLNSSKVNCDCIKYRENEDITDLWSWKIVDEKHVVITDDDYNEKKYEIVENSSNKIVLVIKSSNGSVEERIDLSK